MEELLILLQHPPTTPIGLACFVLCVLGIVAVKIYEIRSKRLAGSLTCKVCAERDKANLAGPQNLALLLVGGAAISFLVGWARGELQIAKVPTPREGQAFLSCQTSSDCGRSGCTCDAGSCKCAARRPNISMDGRVIDWPGPTLVVTEVRAFPERSE